MRDARDQFIRATPGIFVLIWSTGWIAAGYAALYADPLAFLVVRHGLAAAALAAIAIVFRIPWPRDPRAIGHAIVAGTLLNGFYLAGVWWAVRHGVPAGLSGVIAALQPIMTAALAPALLGERIGARQWLGIALGFIGLCIASAPKLAGLDGAAFMAALVPFIVNVLAMLSVTLGSFYQKKFASKGELIPVTALQFAGALVVTLPLAMALEPMTIIWNRTTILTMLWSVAVLSIGGVGLLVFLIRRGAVSRVAVLIYLVPPVAALMAFLAFGETLSPLQIGGLVLTVAGVRLAAAR
ncbi:MAG: peptide ABC transporter ATP-binding protein [Rhizobiales bacterium 65-9]|nr:MAG: peptide ABC transporter ATP-binding protein [Rhizobiales bacterium 65-9]